MPSVKAPIELERHAERQRAEDRQLVGGIDTLDVEGRIGFGVAQGLGLGEDIGEIATLVAHFGQDEVARAVDDAGDPLDVICRQAFANRLDDRDPARDGGLESHHDTTLARGGEDFVAVQCDQCLVGGDHVLAVLDCLEHQLTRRRVTADQLDDDLDLRILDHREGVVADSADRLEPMDPLRIIRARRGMRDFNAAPRAPRDLGRVARQHGHRAAADRSQTQKSDLHRFHACPLVRRPVSRPVRYPDP
jgi:hypothetical protein